MEVELTENAYLPAPSSSSKPTKVTIDDAHPFDLETYISNYSGRTVVDRLVHIIHTCPSLAPHALRLATKHIYQLRDVNLHHTAVAAYDSVQPDTGLPPSAEVAPLDPKWLDHTTKRNKEDRSRLESELKNYTNTMIKESIRLGHGDLGDFFRSTGDYANALKHYSKSREFCTTSQHVLDMCLSVLELLIEYKNYAHISTYVYKAEAALDASTSSGVKERARDAKQTASVIGKAPSTSGASAQVSSATQQTSRTDERDKVQSKLDYASALALFSQQNYHKASQLFLKIGSAQRLGDWVGKIVSQADIAIYGSLCALASLRRQAIKAEVLENSTFTMYIEQEPYVRELIESYMASRFKTTLTILEKYSTRHYLDIHLFSHVQELTNLVRNRALVLYFQPFATISMGRMSEAFGWDVSELEKHVVALIQKGEIEGRIDKKNMVLKATISDHRADLFARVVKTGREMRNTNQKLLLRMKLQQADIILKPHRSVQEEARRTFAETQEGLAEAQ